MAYGSHLERTNLKGLDYYPLHVRPYRSKIAAEIFCLFNFLGKIYLKTHV